MKAKWGPRMHFTKYNICSFFQSRISWNFCAFLSKISLSFYTIHTLIVLWRYKVVVFFREPCPCGLPTTGPICRLQSEYLYLTVAPTNLILQCKQELHEYLRLSMHRTKRKELRPDLALVRDNSVLCHVCSPQMSCHQTFQFIFSASPEISIPHLKIPKTLQYRELPLFTVALLDTWYSPLVSGSFF